MLILFFYSLNLLLFVLGFLGIRLDNGERRFSLALVQVLLGLPLLAGEYLNLAYHFEEQAVRVVLFSEIVFALIWLSMALRLWGATVTAKPKSRLNFIVEILVGSVVTATFGYFLIYCSIIEISNATLTFPAYSPIFFSALFILVTILYTAWRLEQFWRALNTARRWEYKFLMVGGYLICGALAWSASYRLTYLAIVSRHILLLAALLCLGWILMSYAVVHHRLLNRKIFVSRKVVYSFVVPSFLAVYLLGFGAISLIMRTFGLPLSFVMKWLFLALGFVAAGLFAFSGKIRRRIHFFISTHFYINKYEYRDEWLSLSQHLQEVRTEADVVKALHRVLAKSLYTTEIFVWVGDFSQGYRLLSSLGNPLTRSNEKEISPNDPLVAYIETHSHFHIKEKELDSAWRKIAKQKEALLTDLDLRLIAPISIGNNLVGLIGLGPEFAGGRYGHDDFDLLTALGSQAASALLAIRMAEKLAHAREQQAWTRLSAFVLHDIKNAATMLAMLQENAPKHIHEPEFQQDMLELLDNALRRMDRVELRLGTLKDEITPEFQNLELGRYIEDCRHRLRAQLPAMAITVDCRNEIQVRTDPQLLFSILENLLLNAFEAQGEGTVVRIRAGDTGDGSRQTVLEIMDNGPGITEELLPDELFEPFKTNKRGGSGIGLWHVKRIVVSLNGSVTAENRIEGGARFEIKLPLAGDAG